MNVLNQFSYPLIAAGILLVVYLVLKRFVSLRIVIAAQITLVLVFAAAFLALRTGEGDSAAVRDFRSVVSNGRPTFIEFFSNFCTACLVLRPTIDDIIVKVGDDYNVLRVNIHSEEGQAMREAYDFSFTPEFVVLDSNGIEVWRDHAPPSESTLSEVLSG